MKLVKNNFAKTGVTRYEDENKNTLAINCSRDGASISIIGKIQSHSFKNILEFPYSDYSGLHISYSDGSYIEKEHVPILKDMIETIEDWVEIANILHLISLPTNLFADYADKFSKLPENEEIFCNMNNEECQKEIMGQLLSTLYTLHNEEMNEYVKIYLKMLNAEIKN